MKNNIVFFILFLCVASFGLNSCKNNSENIPNFSFKKIGGKVFDNKNIPQNKDVVFCYLDTQCHSCSDFLNEINDIELNPDKFYLIVFNGKVEKDKLSGHSQKENVVYLYDDNNDFVSTFNLGVFISFPTFIIYDKSGKSISTDKNLIL